MDWDKDMKFWITRDKDNLDLYAHETHPYWDKHLDMWNSQGHQYMLDICLFPEVTFENSPQQVEIKLIK